MPAPLPPAEDYSLLVTLEVAGGRLWLEWNRREGPPEVWRGWIEPNPSDFFLRHQTLYFHLQGRKTSDLCNSWPASTRAFVKRLRALYAVPEGAVSFTILSSENLGLAKARQPYAVTLGGGDAWKMLEQWVRHFAEIVVEHYVPEVSPEERNRWLAYRLACLVLAVPPSARLAPVVSRGPVLHDLQVTFHRVKLQAEFRWTGPQKGEVAATGEVRLLKGGMLAWELDCGTERELKTTGPLSAAIGQQLGQWLKKLPTDSRTFKAHWVTLGPRGEPVVELDALNPVSKDIVGWIIEELTGMTEESRVRAELRISGRAGAAETSQAAVNAIRLKLLRRAEKEAAAAAQRQAEMQRRAQVAREREASRREARKTPEAAPARRGVQRSVIPAPSVPTLPAAAVPIHFEALPLTLPEPTSTLEDLRPFFLREQAARWWVANQTDDLLCLPYCRVERLEYQIRTALRVLGPLRGRALLSDEVGLGKTVEAGLIVKELLTRGMVKRFLILTLPSLVDQWEEELSEKFGLPCVTTNHAGARDDPERFWKENPALIASLHTLKQPAQLELAKTVQWDILIVDEAHHLRNRASQAWQAVNVLPRQFLLLLTATPVQNSLEELYHLVTLLQPGQLPSPQEFRTRYLDPKRPRQPRHPEELRRLLGQVMIRNTRANAGLKLPPRHAETVLFEPDADERVFWQEWEGELRTELGKLKPGQSSLWGRLLLQTAGSSPAAWLSALEKFPAAQVARAWRRRAPLAASWQRKCELIPPLTCSEGGAVIFTQFLETQAALGEYLRQARVPAFIINGATPARERQPITEEFRKRGGALLLTHSGTEGRNLQFSHQLVNFDLPWNPMEIEQRIGRLHRLGQRHTVRIHNFVQRGTLQEHLLDLLQEKLNLFELVVGETGLILGERFGSDEFAEEVFRRWKESEEGQVAEAFASLGEELSAARQAYGEIKQLDQTLFSKDYESL